MPAETWWPVPKVIHITVPEHMFKSDRLMALQNVNWVSWNGLITEFLRRPSSDILRPQLSKSFKPPQLHLMLVSVSGWNGLIKEFLHRPSSDICDLNSQNLSSRPKSIWCWSPSPCPWWIGLERCPSAFPGPGHKYAHWRLKAQHFLKTVGISECTTHVKYSLANFFTIKPCDTNITVSLFAPSSES